MKLFYKTLAAFVFANLINIIFGKVIINHDIYNFSMDWVKGKRYKFVNTVSFYGAGQFSKIPMNMKSIAQMKVLDILPNESAILDIFWELPEINLKNHLLGKNNKKINKIVITKDGKLETTQNHSLVLALFKLLPNGSIKKGSKWDTEIESLGNIGTQFLGNDNKKFNCKLIGTVKKKGLNLAKINLMVSEQTQKTEKKIGNGLILINMNDGIVQEFNLILKPNINQNSLVLPIETIKINCIRDPFSL